MLLMELYYDPLKMSEAYNSFQTASEMKSLNGSSARIWVSQEAQHPGAMCIMFFIVIRPLR